MRNEGWQKGNCSILTIKSWVKFFFTNKGNLKVIPKRLFYFQKFATIKAYIRRSKIRKALSLAGFPADAFPSPNRSAPIISLEDTSSSSVTLRKAISMESVCDGPGFSLKFWWPPRNDDEGIYIYYLGGVRGGLLPQRSVSNSVLVLWYLSCYQINDFFVQSRSHFRLNKLKTDDSKMHMSTQY